MCTADAQNSLDRVQAQDYDTIMALSAVTLLDTSHCRDCRQLDFSQ